MKEDIEYQDLEVRYRMKESREENNKCKNNKDVEWEFSLRGVGEDIKEETILGEGKEGMLVIGVMLTGELGEVESAEELQGSMQDIVRSLSDLAQYSRVEDLTIIIIGDGLHNVSTNILHYLASIGIFDISRIINTPMDKRSGGITKITTNSKGADTVDMDMGMGVDMDMGVDVDMDIDDNIDLHKNDYIWEEPQIVSGNTIGERGSIVLNQDSQLPADSGEHKEKDLSFPTFEYVETENIYRKYKYQDKLYSETAEGGEYIYDNIIHTFQCTTSYDWGASDLPPESIPKYNLILSISHFQGILLESHFFLYRGFCSHMNPRFVLTLEAGIRLEEESVSKLYKYMEKHEECGAVTGEIEVDEQHYIWPINGVGMAQFAELKLYHIIVKATQEVIGYVDTLPWMFALFRWNSIKATPLNLYFLPLLHPFTITPFRAQHYKNLSRILGLEILNQPGGRKTTNYVPNAIGKLKVPDNFVEFLSTRSRLAQAADLIRIKELSSSLFWRTNKGQIEKDSKCKRFKLIFYGILLILLGILSFLSVGIAYGACFSIINTAMQRNVTEMFCENYDNTYYEYNEEEFEAESESAPSPKEDEEQHKGKKSRIKRLQLNNKDTSSSDLVFIVVLKVIFFLIIVICVIAALVRPVKRMKLFYKLVCLYNGLFLIFVFLCYMSMTFQSPAIVLCFVFILSAIVLPLAMNFGNITNICILFVSIICLYFILLLYFILVPLIQFCTLNVFDSLQQDTAIYFRRINKPEFALNYLSFKKRLGRFRLKMLIGWLVANIILMMGYEEGNFLGVLVDGIISTTYFLLMLVLVYVLGSIVFVCRERFKYQRLKEYPLEDQGMGEELAKENMKHINLWEGGETVKVKDLPSQTKLQDLHTDTVPSMFTVDPNINIQKQV